MKTLLYLTLIFVGYATAAQPAPDVRKKNFNLTSEGVALSGYDPVSYFTQKEPSKGNARWAFEYKGVVYWFSSAENKATFVGNPEKYEPAYGGWCAYAVGNSAEKVEVDPLTYKIHEGKLLLFYNRFFTNTLTLWNKDESSLFRQAEKNWPSIINR